MVDGQVTEEQIQAELQRMEEADDVTWLQGHVAAVGVLDEEQHEEQQ